MFDGKGVLFLLNLHPMFRFPRTVDTAFARALLAAHDARSETRAILLIALGFLASAKYFFLLLDFLGDVAQEQVFAPDALLAAVILHAEFVFGLEA